MSVLNIPQQGYAPLNGNNEVKMDVPRKCCHLNRHYAITAIAVCAFSASLIFGIVNDFRCGNWRAEIEDLEHDVTRAKAANMASETFYRLQAEINCELTAKYSVLTPKMQFFCEHLPIRKVCSSIIFAIKIH